MLHLITSDFPSRLDASPTRFLSTPRMPTRPGTQIQFSFSHSGISVQGGGAAVAMAGPRREEGVEAPHAVSVRREPPEA